MPPLLTGEIEKSTGLYNALIGVKDLDISCGVLRIASENCIALVGISSSREIVGAVLKDENASKLTNSAAVDKILSMTQGKFEFYEVPQKELSRLDQKLGLDISSLISEQLEQSESDEEIPSDVVLEEGFPEQLPESSASEEELPAELDTTAAIAGGTKAEDESPNTVAAHDEALPVTASDHDEALPAAATEDDTIPQSSPTANAEDPFTVGDKNEGALLSGAGEHEGAEVTASDFDEADPAIQRPSVSELDAIQFLSSAAAAPLPLKSDLDSIQAPRSSNVQQTGSLLAKFKDKKPGAEAQKEDSRSVEREPGPSIKPELQPFDPNSDELQKNAAETVERIKKFRRPDAELEAEAEKAQRHKFASSKKSFAEAPESSGQPTDGEGKRIRPASKQTAPVSVTKTAPKAIPKATKIAIGAVLVLIGGVLVIREPVATSFVNNAQSQFDKRDFAAAKSTLATATLLDPWNAKAHYLNGQIAKAQGENSKAFDELKQAMEAHPNDPETLKAYILAARKIGRFDLVKSGTESLMEHDASAAADGYWLGMLGQAKFNLSEFKEASTDYTKALKAGLKTPWIFTGRAWAELYAGNPKLAVKDFDTALAFPKDKSQADGLVGKGQALVQLKDYKGALAAYDAALAMDGKLSYAYLRRAALFMILNQPDNAMVDYDHALKVDPKLSAAHVGKADVFAKKQKLDLALKELKGVQGVDFERAALQIQANQFGPAAASLKKGLETNSTDPNKFMDLAYCYSRLNKPADAESACAKAVALAPKNSGFVAMHGFYLKQLGQAVRARAEYETAIGLDPNNAEAHLWRGMISAEANDLVSARQDFQEAARLKPSLSAAINAMKKSDRKYLAASSASTNVRQKALPLIEGDYQTLLTTGYTKLKGRQYPGAVQYLASAVKQNPNSVEAKRYLAYALSMQGNFNDAIAQYKEICSMGSGSHASDQRILADLLIKADRDDEAVEVYMGMLVNNVHDSDARCRLANCYASTGKIANGIDVLESGKKMDPGSSAIYDKLIYKISHGEGTQSKMKAPTTQSPLSIPSG